MKRILITGASGLVGYDVVMLLMRNQEFQVFSTYHSQKNDYMENVIYIDLEIDSLECLNIQFDYIVHCAARIPNDIYSDEQVSYMNRHIDDNVINYCKHHKCKLIYLSGTAVYGSKNREKVTEQSKLSAESKYIFEKINWEIRIVNECESYCILRISSPYGMRQKNITVFKKFVTAAYKGENLYYFGTGKRMQNFIAVSDISQAVMKCIIYEKNGIFNIASKYSISMKNLAYLVLEVARGEIKTESEVCAGDCIDNQEDVRINIDIGLAEKELGWTPQIELKDGIRKWIESMKKGEIF